MRGKYYSLACCKRHDVLFMFSSNGLVVPLQRGVETWFLGHIIKHNSLVSKKKIPKCFSQNVMLLGKVT